jgi:hypothetical protein
MQSLMPMISRAAVSAIGRQGGFQMVNQPELFKLRSRELAYSSPEFRRALEEYYANEANFNVTMPYGFGNGAEFPDTTPWFSCSNWAVYVRRVEGPVAQLYGFFETENPHSRIARVCGGHDFAVVTDRFIVDGWVVNVEGLCNRAVFDLADPADKDVIRDLYGDPKIWMPHFRREALEAAVDRESADERRKALTGVVIRPGALGLVAANGSNATGACHSEAGGRIP